MSFQFEAPWILALAVLIPALLAARQLWASRRTKPATMAFATTSLTKGLNHS